MLSIYDYLDQIPQISLMESKYATISFSKILEGGS